MSDFISKIQNSDHEIKKRWMIIFSSLTMVFIVVMWVFYMNAYIFNKNQANVKEELEVGFWPVFKNGAAAIGGMSKDKTKAFISEIIDNSFLKKERVIEVEL